MWRQFMESFAVGVSLGPACFMHCGLYQSAFLVRHARPNRGQQTRLCLSLAGGRLCAYVLFGILVGLLARSGVVVVRPWVLTAGLGILMVGYALWPDRGVVCLSRFAWPKLLGGGFALGMVTGLSPCPPFLASVTIALRSHGVAAAVLTLVAFFLGSSLYLLPLWLGAAVLPQRVRQRLQRTSRWVAAGVAVYAFLAVWRALAGEPGGPGHAPGHRHQPAPKRVAAAAIAKEGEREGKGLPAPLPPVAGKDVRPLFVKKPPTRVFTEALLQRLNLSLEEARYYTGMGDGVVQCDLCPTRCILDQGEQGMCRTRVNIDGKLRSIVYGRPISVHVDPIEKKPLFHVLPSSRAFSVATVGCNLGCVFCQNYEISQTAPEDAPRHDVPPEQLVALCLKHKCDGIAYTYTEPTVFFEYMVDTARLARASGLKNYWVTCGYIEEKPLLELCTVLDAANVDLKGFSDEFYVKYSNAHLYPVLRTLKILRREQVFFEITNLIVPGGNDSPEMIRAMCRWIVAELGTGTPLHFSRFHPAYKLTKTPPTPLATLESARAIAREEGLKYVYIGNTRSPEGEGTVCPGCGKTVINRVGYVVRENSVSNGTCASCGASIPGVWR